MLFQDIETIVEAHKQEVLKAMGEALGMIPEKYRGNSDEYEDELLEAEEDVDDNGLNRLTTKSHFIYVLTQPEIKKWEFGTSDNEIAIPIENNLTIYVVGM